MSRPTIDRARAALLRALKPLLGDHVLVEAKSVEWASATFAGGRHALKVTPRCDLSAEDRVTLSERIAGLDFALPGLLVADITAESEGDTLSIEALILEEA